RGLRGRRTAADGNRRAGSPGQAPPQSPAGDPDPVDHARPGGLGVRPSQSGPLGGAGGTVLPRRRGGDPAGTVRTRPVLGGDGRIVGDGRPGGGRRESRAPVLPPPEPRQVAPLPPRLPATRPFST